MEVRFRPTRHGVSPSVEVLEASARRNSGAISSVRVEHLRVWRACGTFCVIVFVVAAGPDEAKEFALTLGSAITTDIRHVRCSGFHVWRDAGSTEREEQAP